MTKIIFFDMDSTLIAGEGLDALASHKNLSDQILPITQATMDGTIPFEDAFYQKICTLDPSRQDIAWLNQRYIDHQDTSIPRIFEKLRTLGWEIGILSHTFGAGIEQFISQHRLLGQYIHTNTLMWDAVGNFASVDPRQAMMQGDGKKTVIADYQNHGYGPIVMVGDSVGDMKTQGIADYFIGYGKHIIRPLVQKQAEYFVESLDEVCDILLMK